MSKNVTPIQNYSEVGDNCYALCSFFPMSDISWKNDTNFPRYPILYQHRWILHVWVRICHSKIVGPHFFEHTVSGANYLQFLQNHLPEYIVLKTFHKISARDVGFSKMLLQLIFIIMLGLS